MREVKVQQLLHGYRHGHELLAGSIRLPSKQADLIARLSDISGSIGANSKFAPYLTMYPLPGDKYYAVARTWSDEHAARAGCVLTHTLLFPQATWSELRSPSSVERLFSFPTPNGRSNEQYGCSLNFRCEYEDEASPAVIVSPTPMASEFVSRFFGDGLRPLVWFGEVQPDELAWKIVNSLWPKLRSTFSCCTFGLQPRSLEERQFDLLFAPSSAYSRFRKFSGAQTLDASSRKANVKPSDAEPWCCRWAGIVFSGIHSGDMPPFFSSLWSELGADPTSIRRLYLLEELRERARNSPIAAVGVLDIVESLSPLTGGAPSLKEAVAHEAISVASHSPDLVDAVRCLRLVDDRLRRPAFLSVPESVRNEVSTVVETLMERSPDLVLGAGQSLFSLPKEAASSPFLNGMYAGLSRLGDHDPAQLQVLRKFSDVAPQIISRDPRLASAYFLGLVRPVNTDALRDLLSWVTSLRERAVTLKLRSVLLPVLGRGEGIDLVTELLRGVSEDEVPGVLDLLCEPSLSFHSDAIREVVEKFVAVPYPSAVRAWAASTSEWSSGVARLAASTFQPTVVGLEGLLDAQDFTRSRKTEVIAMYCRSVGHAWLPSWLRNHISRDPELLWQLLVMGSDMPEDAIPEVVRILGEIRYVPVSLAERFGPKLDSMRNMPFFGALVDCVMRGVVSEWVRGQVGTLAFESWVSRGYALNWLRNVPARDLEVLVTKDVSAGGDALMRSWRFVEVASLPLLTRDSYNVAGVIESLLTNGSQDWPESIADSWAAILRCSRVRARGHIHLSLCVQALRFGFSNHRLPVGRVVSEAFFDVYEAVTAGEKLPVEAGNLFGFFDWDKGKELRRALVEAFMSSIWSPGLLAMAVPDARLLRKIVRRVSRQWAGQRYVQAMVIDLASHEHPEYLKVYGAMIEILRSTDLEEDWD